MRKRTTQTLLAIAIVALGAPFVRPAPAPEQARAGQVGNAADAVRARLIELVDDRGQVRASLKVEPSGETVFRLIDATGTIRVKVGGNEDGSGLLLLDDKTAPGVHVLATKKGTTVTLAEGAAKKVIKP